MTRTHTLTHSHNSVNEELQQILLSTSHHLPHYSHLTTNLHIIPDYHGNRSPLADPAILGMVYVNSR